MKPIDYAKALGIAAALLIVDVLIAIGVVYLYSILVDPGHPRTYYETSGIVVARWSTRTAGTALLFAAAWLFAQRRPNRNAYMFAIAITLFYALLDGASVGFRDVFIASFAFTIGLKLAGSLAGALVATRSRSATA